MHGQAQDAPLPLSDILEQYKEWRRGTELWSLATKLPEEKQGPKVLGMLEGPAWEACRRLEVAKVSTKARLLI